jgi:hypothetical protein
MPDLRSRTTQTLSTRVSCLAYMDDTTWVASSRENLQTILDDATQFYHANDSQVNGSKSKIIAINAKIEDKKKPLIIGPQKDKVLAAPQDEPIRFLGIWFSEKNHHKIIPSIIKHEIDRVTNIIRFKSMTDKQAHYIISKVLLPRIEYRLSNGFLSIKECKTLTSSYMKIFKHSIKISSTCPNSAIQHPGIYNLRDLENLQNEMHINNLLNRLNEHSLVYTTTIMRLKDLQINNWEPKNIMSENLQYKLNTKNNLSGKILCAAHNYGIKFTGPHIQEYFNWNGGNYSIKEILRDEKVYNKSINSLRSRNIMFIDQLIDTANKYIISWPLLVKLTTTATKGRIPKWHQKICTLLSDPNSIQPQRLSP